jgi:hypothetical protein
MNCFNIRELQGVLKRKFFTDLVNTSDHREFLNQSIIGLRFKSNNQLSIIPDLESFFNMGLTNTSKAKTNLFSNSYSSLNEHSVTTLTSSNLVGVTDTLNLLINRLFSIISSLNFNSILSLLNPIKVLQYLSTSNLTLTGVIMFNKSENLNIVKTNKSIDINYTTDNIDSNSSVEKINNTFSEISNNTRFTRFNNPLISYDYKCGHYLGI